MLKIRTEAEARGLTETELIGRLETGRLATSAVFPTLEDELAFERWLAERAAAERAAAARRTAREVVSLVYRIENERRRGDRRRARLGHVLRCLAAAVDYFLQALRSPPPGDRDAVAHLTLGV